MLNFLAGTVAAAVVCSSLIVTTAPVAPLAPPSSATVALATELDITAESVTLAGLSVEQGKALLAALDAAQEAKSLIAEAKEKVTQGLAAVQTAQEAVMAGQNAPALVSARDAALAALVAAREDLTATLNQVRKGLMTACGQEVSDRMEKVVDRLGAAMPPEFFVLTRTKDEWRAIHNALRYEKRAIDRNETVSADVAALLAGVRSNPEVVAAKQRVDANLAAMKDAFKPA